jgi:hypothetical protein
MTPTASNCDGARQACGTGMRASISAQCKPFVDCSACMRILAFVHTVRLGCTAAAGYLLRRVLEARTRADIQQAFRTASQCHEIP